MTHGSWVTWVMGQELNGSLGSWVTLSDPFPALIGDIPDDWQQPLLKYRASIPSTLTYLSTKTSMATRLSDKTADVIMDAHQLVPRLSGGDVNKANSVKAKANTRDLQVQGQRPSRPHTSRPTPTPQCHNTKTSGENRNLTIKYTSCHILPRAPAVFSKGQIPLRYPACEPARWLVADLLAIWSRAG